MSSNARDGAAATNRQPEGTADMSSRPPKRAISSAELFGGARVVAIEHEGETYTLRQTSSGKLILTK